MYHEFQVRKVDQANPVSDTTPPASAAALPTPEIPILNTPMAVRYSEWREEAGPPTKILPTIFEVLKTIHWPKKLAAGFLLCSLVTVSTGGALALLGMAMLFAFLGFLLNPGKARDAQLLKSIQEMAEDGSQRQIPVEIFLSCDRFEFDSDAGLLSIVDGSLYFTSERATFSFSPRVARQPAHSFLLTTKLEFFRHGLVYTIRFRALSPSTDLVALVDALRLWAGSRVKPGAMEVLPPTRPSRSSLLKVLRDPVVTNTSLFFVALVPIVVKLDSLGRSGMDHPMVQRWAIASLLAVATFFAINLRVTVKRKQESLSALTREGGGW